MTAPNLTPEHLQSLLDGWTLPQLLTCGAILCDKNIWFDESGARHGDTPNFAIQCGTNETADLLALAPDLARRVIELEAVAAKLADALHHMVNASTHPDQAADDALSAYEATR